MASHAHEVTFEEFVPITIVGPNTTPPPPETPEEPAFTGVEVTNSSIKLGKNGKYPLTFTDGMGNPIKLTSVGLAQLYTTYQAAGPQNQSARITVSSANVFTIDSAGSDVYLMLGEVAPSVCDLTIHGKYRGTEYVIPMTIEVTA